MPLSPEQQTKRNALIVRARVDEELSWEKIGEKHDLSPRQCRNVYRRWMEQGAPIGTTDPIEMVDDLLRGFMTDLWEFTEAADAAWEAKNLNAVVGAVRSRMDARVKAIELLQATGRLPKDLGKLRVEHDVRFMIEQVIGVFEEYDVPEEAQQALIERLHPQALIEASPPPG
jgi:hypothetical protein